MLKQRIITAIWLVVLALSAIFLLDDGGFSLFVALVVGLGGWEWARMAGVQQTADQLAYAASVSIVCGMVGFVPDMRGPVLILALLWWLSVFALVVSYPAYVRALECKKLRLAAGFLTLVPAWLSLSLIKSWPNGSLLILLVMLLVAATDIGGYFVGRRYGRVKLAPAVSPGKTREGALGGMAAAAVIVVLASLVCDWTVRGMLAAVVGSALVVVSAIVGDLSISVFKRQAGIKDTGNLLPGHGGVLDRIDSLLAAAPMFALLMWLQGWGSL